MTICVAVRAGMGYHLATDSLVGTNTGSGSTEMLSVPKLISAGHAKILYCGTVSLCQELAERCSGNDAEVVAIQLAGAIRRKRGRKRGPLDAEFLVCDGTKLISVAGDGALIPVSNHYAAIGEKDMAIGAMWGADTVVDGGMVAEALAKHAVYCCIANTTSCGGEVKHVFLPART